MSDEAIKALVDAAEIVRKRNEHDARKLEILCYKEYRKALTDKTYIDKLIVDAMANKKRKVVILQSKYHPFPDLLFEIPRYGQEKSLMDALRELYPTPFKVSGKSDSNFVGENDKGLRQYKHYYIIKIKWTKKMIKQIAG